MHRFKNVLLSFFSGVLLFALSYVVIGCGGTTNTEQSTAGWEKTFGGFGVNIGNAVQQTSDGGFIIAGQTNSFGAGQWDIYLIRTDAQGNGLWSKTFGGPADENGNAVQQTSDGGFIIAGQTNSFGAGKYDVYLVKTDAQGNTLWSKTFGSAEDDIASSVKQTTDGGYIIVGTTGAIYSSRVHSDVYLIKTDPNGNAIWTKTYSESSINYGNSVQQTPDGGYIIAGTTFDFSSMRSAAYTVKTDHNGNILWTKTFEDSSHDITSTSVQLTSDNGYTILGDSVVAILIKMDSGGNVLWTKTLEEGGASFDRTSDDGFIVLGNKGDAFSNSIYLVRTDSDGNTLWSKLLVKGGERGTAIQQVPDGGFVIVGSTQPYSGGLVGVVIIKTDSNGDL